MGRLRAYLHLGAFLTEVRRPRPKLRRAMWRFYCRHPRLRLRNLFRRRRWYPGDGYERLFPDAPPFLGGVREPRRPKPTPPADSVALSEPHE